MTEVTEKGLVAAISALKVEPKRSVLNHLAVNLTPQESIYLYFQAKVLIAPDLNSFRIVLNPPVGEGENKRETDVDSNAIFNAMFSTDLQKPEGLETAWGNHDWEIVLTQKRFVCVRKPLLGKTLGNTIDLDDISTARIEGRIFKRIVLLHSRFGTMSFFTSTIKLETISDTINLLKAGSQPYKPTLGQYSTGNFERNYQQGYRRELVPSEVQRLVWERDNGQCVKCGSKDNLQFDHIIPVSRGGNNSAANIQILCRRCNLRKSNRIGG